MRLTQILYEAEIPPTSYGYWITDTGEFLKVEYEQHDAVAKRNGTYYGAAMDKGWIRVLAAGVEHSPSNELILNYQLGATGIRAISSALRLIRQSDTNVRIELSGRSWSGNLFNRSEAATILRKTSAKSVSTYTQDDWDWVTKFPLKMPKVISEAEFITEQNTVYEDMIQSFVRLFQKHGFELETVYLNTDKNGERRAWNIPGSPRKESWIVDDLRRELKWGKENLKRKDRIVWFMWHTRLNVIYRQLDRERRAMNDRRMSVMFTNRNNPDKKRLPIPEPSEELVATQKIFNEYLKSYEKKFGHKYPVAEHGEFGYLEKPVLKHYASLDEVGATDVTEVIWYRQTPYVLISQLEAAEENWRAAVKENSFVKNEIGDEIILNFPDGFMWVLLDRSSCSVEGEVMGHCGNAGGKSGERILSLRRIEKRGNKEGLKPHLTFILSDKGSLGEMKARFNKKPDTKYHPYIVALLKLPMIKYVSGGGYMPQNNFDLDDLSDDLKKELYQARLKNPIRLGRLRVGAGSPVWEP